MFTDMNNYLSMPRLNAEAETDALLDEHFEQEWSDLNARWDDVA